VVSHIGLLSTKSPDINRGGVGSCVVCWSDPPTGSTPAEAPFRQGPQPVRPGDHGIGRFVPETSFVDLAGKTQNLSELAKARVTVFAMTSTSCPLSKKYLPTLVEADEPTAISGR
jgi:hypothetical protein